MPFWKEMFLNKIAWITNSHQSPVENANLRKGQTWTSGYTRGGIINKILFEMYEICFWSHYVGQYATDISNCLFLNFLVCMIGWTKYIKIFKRNAHTLTSSCRILCKALNTDSISLYWIRCSMRSQSNTYGVIWSYFWVHEIILAVLCWGFWSQDTERSLTPHTIWHSHSLAER
jgi:hypothetical protein